eukprot:6127175-Pyramimonas_sp.AAC.1
MPIDVLQSRVQSRPPGAARVPKRCGALGLSLSHSHDAKLGALSSGAPEVGLLVVVVDGGLHSCNPGTVQLAKVCGGVRLEPKCYGLRNSSSRAAAVGVQHPRLFPMGLPQVQGHFKGRLLSGWATLLAIL